MRRLSSPNVTFSRFIVWRAPSSHLQDCASLIAILLFLAGAWLLLDGLAGGPPA
jgi:hypothetical protein